MVSLVNNNKNSGEKNDAELLRIEFQGSSDVIPLSVDLVGSQELVICRLGT